MNSRMIQAIFDDANPNTAKHWAYPDTGVWDAERNTDEFCAMLHIYKQYGMLAFTVGLQGGGSVYTAEVYDHYEMSAFVRDGSLKPVYFERLARILKTADELGMVVIVSYLYVISLKYLDGQQALENAIQNATEWLLNTGYENIIVEVMNEAREGVDERITTASIPRLIELTQAVQKNGRRFLVGISPFPDYVVPSEAWLSAEDITLPHGNNHTPLEVQQKLRNLKSLPAYKKRPRPLLINEDSVMLANMDAALAEGASWGFYHQGLGSDYRFDRFVQWFNQPREQQFEALSGFQTLPVNWAINDPWKEAFFNKLHEVTGGFDG